jgi:hypothetical protein
MATLDQMLLAADNEMDQDQDEGKVRDLEGFRVLITVKHDDVDEVVRLQFLKALFRSLVMAIKASNAVPGQGRPSKAVFSIALEVYFYLA